MQQTDPKGQAFTYSHDELNRQTGQSFPANDDIVHITTTYDANSNIDIVTEQKAAGVEEITDQSL